MELPNSKPKLPERMRGLFWSYVFENIDPAKDIDIIIPGVINYGRLEDWRWVKGFYGSNKVVETIKSFPVTQFRPQALKLASILFHFELKDKTYVSRYA